MVKIRLRRAGKKANPSYKIVVADSRYPRDGKFIQIIGHYDPFAKTDSEKFEIDVDMVKHWVEKGAQMTSRVEFLYKKCTA